MMHKLLLLGAGESGKSTLAKQVKLIHLAGFTEDEKKSYRLIINQNIITSMQTLIEGAAQFGYNLKGKSVTKAAAMLSDASTLHSYRCLYSVMPLTSQVTIN